jgi:hypothetical protein
MKAKLRKGDVCVVVKERWQLSRKDRDDLVHFSEVAEEGDIVVVLRVSFKAPVGKATIVTNKLIEYPWTFFMPEEEKKYRSMITAVHRNQLKKIGRL